MRSIPWQSGDRPVETLPVETRAEAFRQAEFQRDEPQRKIFRRLELYFAILTVLGAFVLAIGHDGAVIPLMAILFAIIGYVMVDLLRWFALPPTAAHVAMALATVVCIADFSDMSHSPGPRQLLALAHLLVLVQAILMMQRKSKRIFEQLAIFCLLELIVAAVINHTLSFGMLLVPILVVAAAALGLLAAASAVDPGPSVKRMSDGNPEGSPRGWIEVLGSRSSEMVATRADTFSKLSVVMFAPGILLIAAVFFYALPRTSDSPRAANASPALVGFSDRVQLEQLGQMLQNPAIALQVGMVDRANGEPYRVVDGLYLRGRVLEKYTVDHRNGETTSTWEATKIQPGLVSGRLPLEYVPADSTDFNFFDTVNVAVDCASLRTNSLFAIAPYHRSSAAPGLRHIRDRWTLRGRDVRGLDQPRIAYSFGTNAFHNGVQTEWIARSIGEVGTMEEQIHYRNELLSFEIESMPTIAKIGNDLVGGIGVPEPSPYRIAKSIEQHFASSSEYRYSLNLNADRAPGVDPIEQFVRVNRTGHCQFFASAAAMMLRSQQIPARVVVGYYTNEYNQWSHQYIARQSHAHAWVEALIDQDQRIDQTRVYGQPESNQYWLRLDPTPPAERGGQEPGTIQQSIDLAQQWWEDHVIEMDTGEQQASPISGGIHARGEWYQDAVDWLRGQIRRIRAGFLGGEALTRRVLLSWPAILGVVVLVVGLFLFSRAHGSRLPRAASRRKADDAPPEPTIQFYATLLSELERVGIYRRRSDTPEEFARIASGAILDRGAPSIRGPMERLTARFYRHRFGTGLDSELETDRDAWVADLAAIQASVESMLRAESETSSVGHQANRTGKEPAL